MASIEEDTPAPKVYHNHVDHLNSAGASTDQIGYITQELAYYPFGGLRIDNQYSSIDNPKKFTGFELDRETNLNYAGARYYDQDVGRFTSQDSVSLALGNPGVMQQKMDSTFDLYLKNPQAQNSYSYTANNPLKYKDKNGEWLDVVVDVGFTLYSGYKLGEAILTGGDVKGEAINFALDAGGALIPGVVGAGTARRAIQNGDEIVGAASKFKNSRPSYGSGQVDNVWNNAKGPDGLVRDPNTGDVIDWSPGQSRNGVWDMGHKPGQEYNTQLQRLQNGEITEQQFLDHYRNADNYQPELPSNNRSRKYEDKDTP